MRSDHRKEYSLQFSVLVVTLSTASGEVHRPPWNSKSNRNTTKNRDDFIQQDATTKSWTKSTRRSQRHRTIQRDATKVMKELNETLPKSWRDWMRRYQSHWKTQRYYKSLKSLTWRHQSHFSRRRAHRNATKVREGINRRLPVIKALPKTGANSARRCESHWRTQRDVIKVTEKLKETLPKSLKNSTRRC